MEIANVSQPIWEHFQIRTDNKKQKTFQYSTRQSAAKLLTNLILIKILYKSL